jgi:hypothetical protein
LANLTRKKLRGLGFTLWGKLDLGGQDGPFEHGISIEVYGIGLGNSGCARCFVMLPLISSRTTGGYRALMLVKKIGLGQ